MSALAVGLALCAGLQLVFSRLAPRIGLVKPNYAGKPIMASYGLIAFPYVVAAVVTLLRFGRVDKRDAVLYLWVMAAMWLLGLLDDLFGSREVGGFKGHFRKLVFERRLTTGAVKALGGGAVGVVAGWVISNGEPIRWALSAMLIPLCANLLNLLDLRPGRAVAVFFLGLGVTYIVAFGRLPSLWIVGTLAVVAFVFGIFDSRGRMMMGDSGSNSLGAALGVTMALSTGPVFQAAAIAVIAAVHFYSEKRSISDLIEHNAALRAIDRRLGVR